MADKSRPVVLFPNLAPAERPANDRGGPDRGNQERSAPALPPPAFSAPIPPSDGRRNRRAYGRSLGDFGLLSPVEVRLLECVARGIVCDLRPKFPRTLTELPASVRAAILNSMELGEDHRRQLADPFHLARALAKVLPADHPLRWQEGACLDHALHSRLIRATFFRFLVLGGDEHAPVHENGIQLIGGVIAGDCDFEGVRAECLISVRQSRFTGPLNLYAAELKGLDLSGSLLAAIHGARLQIEGDLVLGGGAVVEGGVDLAGARMAGNLVIDGGAVGTAGTSHEGRATLDFSDATIAGDVQMSGGAVISGTVAATKAQIAGDCHLHGAVIQARGGVALDLSGAQIAGGLWVSGPVQPDGAQSHLRAQGDILLYNARLGSLIDHPAAWPSVDEGDDDDAADDHAPPRRAVLGLDGLKYDRLGPGAPFRARWRIAWLRAQPEAHWGKQFRPQPFNQLASVLRDMGYDRDAAKIEIHKHDRQLTARLLAQPNWLQPLVAPVIVLQWLVMGVLLGHGHRLWRVAALVAAITIAAGAVFDAAGRRGVIAPVDPAIALDARFATCRPPEGNWVACVDNAQMGLEMMPRFSGYLYALDVAVPLFEGRQTASWAPLDRPFRLKMPEIAISEGQNVQAIAVPERFLPGLARALEALGLVSVVLVGGVLAWRLSRRR